MELIQLDYNALTGETTLRPYTAEEVAAHNEMFPTE